MPDAASPGWNKIGELMEGLAYAQRPIHAAVREITKQLGLGRRGAFILNLVAEGSEYPNELATKLRTSRSLITADLNRLIDAGLIESTAGVEDKRMTRLHLTGAGRKVCADIRNEMARIVVRNLARYSDSDLQLFTEMLVAVRRLDPGEETL
jgi:DNA-binding MarR family transcriptional regulator